jgi:hypothetical protein
VESQAIAVIGAGLLQWAMSLPIHLDNELVNYGFNFVSGIANMFFILIFVVIAFAFIFKTENFGMKKALPNLLLIAILINFSRLFVGIVIDVFDVFLNGLMTAFGENIVSLAWEPLKTSGFSVLAWLTTLLATHSVAALVPYASVVSTAALISGAIIDLTMTGLILRTIFLIVINVIIGLTFLSYASLFLIRVVVIWMLAIFAPLAFLASILPATKKYFNLWVHYLISWGMLGVVAVFLVGLGLKFFAITGNSALLDWGGAIGYYPSFIYNYLFLIIYLLITFYVAKRFVPAGADTIISQVGGLTGKAWKSLSKTRTMGQIAGFGANQLGKTFNWAQMLENDSKKGNAFGRNVIRPLAWTTKKAASIPLTGLIDYAAKTRKRRLPSGWDQMTISDKETLINTTRREEDKFVLMSAMKKEGTLTKASPKLQEESIRIAGALKNSDYFLRERGDIADTFANRITSDVKINLEVGEKARVEMGQKIEAMAKSLSREIEMKPILDNEAKRLLDTGAAATQSLADEMAAKNLAASYIHVTGMKSGDMKDMAKSAVESEIVGRALRDTTPQHLQAVQNNFKPETINKAIKNAFEKMFEGIDPVKGLDEYYRSDPKHARMVHWAASTPAGKEFNLPLRQYMTDINGQPTGNIDSYEKKHRINKILTGSTPEFQAFYGNVRGFEENALKQKGASETLSLMAREAERRKDMLEVTRLKNELKKSNEEAKRLEDAALVEINKMVNTPGWTEKNLWEEIVNIRTKKKMKNK